MLINVGEAYIVVNILSGPLGLDSDIQESAALAGSASMNGPQLHLPPNFEQESNLSASGSRLKLKIFGGPSAGEVYFYKNEGQDIIIGRTPDCDIRINDKLLSKNQASIKYVVDLESLGLSRGVGSPLTNSPLDSEPAEPGAWVLSDGLNGKPSTNGTWLYLNEDFEMHTGMVFKAN